MVRSRRAILRTLSLVLLAVCLASAPHHASAVSAASGAPAWPGGDNVQKLAADYVAEYQKQLTAIVADEVYVQEILAQNPVEKGRPRSRTTRGEVFFLFAAAEHEWMAIRDVREVDGAALPASTDVRETLRTLPPAQVAGRMRTYNARFNIGRIERNINEPTLALLALDRSHRSRFRFKTGKARQDGGRLVVPLSFQERERPTLIRNSGGAPLYTTGELLVEQGSGRIWQSRLAVSVDGIAVELMTDYAFDERLELLLPAVFRERYEQGKPAAYAGGLIARPAAHELLVTEGRYSNFRRFEASSRIRLPGLTSDR